MCDVDVCCVVCVTVMFCFGQCVLYVLRVPSDALLMYYPNSVSL